MPVEIGLWRVDDQPVRLPVGQMPSEKRLEDLIEGDADILGQPLLIIGRQVYTDFGKVIDLLAVDGDGAVHVLELKRDRTARDVVAQALDYGSWVQTLDHKRVLTIYQEYAGTSVAFEEAFEGRFGAPPPEQLNVEHRLTIIAAEVDDATERIVQYLAQQHGVPINVVFFRYYEDAGHAYLARTWLIDHEPTPETSNRGAARTKETWNGRDWYVSFGDSSDTRDWEDAVRYGFVSAGGGDWYSRSIQKLPVGGRVFAYIPQCGYVGVGEVVGEPTPFDQARVDVEGELQLLADQPLKGTYRHADASEEWVVPVRWQTTRPRADAFTAPGLYANQNSATRLRNQFTLDRLAAEFELDQ